MTAEQLTVALARRVMRWSVGPDRFLLGHRSWIRRAQFEPTKRIEHAFRLLEKAAPQCWTMTLHEDGALSVQVQICGRVSEARHLSKPLAITVAVARAFDIEVNS